MMSNLNLPKEYKIFPFLMGLSSKEVVYNRLNHPSLAASIAKAELPYLPGVYFVFDFTKDTWGKLLYVGRAGGDKDNNINCHQIPRRLLATINPHQRYRSNTNMPKAKDISRNKAWKIMMQEDKIDTIKIICFHSKINDDLTIENNSNPLMMENKINIILREKGIVPFWTTR